MYKRRTQLSGGEKGNGFEMWRTLLQEYQGGSMAVALGGSRRLQEWPRRNRLEQLSANLEDCVECLTTRCAELLRAPGVLRSMVLGVIPSDYEDELLAKPHIKNWQEIVEWGKTKTVYKNQKVLAEAARKPSNRVNMLAYIEAEGDAKAPKPDAVVENADSDAPQWFQEFVHALPKKGRPATPSKGPSQLQP